MGIIFKSFIAFSNAFIISSLLCIQSLFALPSIDPEFAEEYQRTREQTHFDDLKILESAYLLQNSFLRTIRQTQETEIEVYLTNRISGYSFFSPDAALPSLERIIESTLKNKTHTPPAQMHLILGDAYHWMGHVYEEKGELTKAYESYVRSHVHYQKTPIQSSPRINSRVIVQDHGFYHLKLISQVIKSFVSEPGFQSQLCSSVFR